MLYINKPVKNSPAVHLSPEGESAHSRGNLFHKGSFPLYLPPEKDLLKTPRSNLRGISMQGTYIFIFALLTLQQVGVTLS